MKLGWLLLAVAACGSSAGADDDAGPAPDGGGDACGVCPATACGNVVDSCGNTIACDLCRYDGDPVGAGSGPVRLAIGTGVDVVYGDVFTKTIATRGAPWTTEAVTDYIGDLTGFARAADGTPWLLFDDSANGVTLAHESGGVWTSEAVAHNAYVGALALASDGTPWVAVGGQNPLNGDRGILLAHRDGAGTWTYTLAKSLPNGPAYIDLALTADGPLVAWSEVQSSTLDAAIPDGQGGFTAEVVDPALLGGADHHLEVGVDGAGRPVIAYRHDSPFDRAIGYAVRDGGAWVLSLASSYKFGDGDVRMAISPTTGEVAIAYEQDEGYQLALLDGGAWSVQTVAGESCAGDLDVGFDGDTLLVARACAGQIDLITRTSAHYPTDYATTCATVADALCTKGASCAGPGTGDCCIGDGWCAGPETWCVALASSDICGDPTLDPSVLDGCSQATGALTCTTNGGEEGVVVPASCPYSF